MHGWDDNTWRIACMPDLTFKPQDERLQQPAHRAATFDFCRRRVSDKNQKDPFSRGAWLRMLDPRSQ